MEKYLISLNLSYSKDFEVEAETEEEARTVFVENIYAYINEATTNGDEEINYEVVKEEEGE